MHPLITTIIENKPLSSNDPYTTNGTSVHRVWVQDEFRCRWQVQEKNRGGLPAVCTIIEKESNRKVKQ